MDDGGGTAVQGEGKECFQPRRYQVEACKIAMGRNTIVVMETGSGKTMIAVMLIKEMGKDIVKFSSSDFDFVKEDMKMMKRKKIIVFLAPTVHLVNQQYATICDETGFDVGQYYGAKGVDGWTFKCWVKEVTSHHVLVMTPQILLDALRSAFLTLDIIKLMIFDECHHATGSHPYSRIMKEFYHKCENKPHIFGMTGSPVAKSGVLSSIDCKEQINQLERMLDSRIYTVPENTELEIYVPSAKETNQYYDKFLFVHNDLNEKLQNLFFKYYNTSPDQLQDLHCIKMLDSDDEKAVKKRLSCYQSKISYCIENFGIFCAHEATKTYIDSIATKCSDDMLKHGQEILKAFLKDVLSVIEENLPNDQETLLESETSYSKAIDVGYISPKLHGLVQICLTFRKSSQVQCLIFVERKITAKVLQSFIKKLTGLSHLEVSYLTGGGTNSSIDSLTRKIQKETIDKFRSGKVNLLITTDVAEEGIDVPNCSSVIRFDLPKTVRSYVQSRGRARRPDSTFFIMLERGNATQNDLLSDIIRSEHSITDTAKNSNPNSYIGKLSCEDDSNLYTVDSTGAIVTVESSVNLIDRYCYKLPKDKNIKPNPRFEITRLGNSGCGSYQCTLVLPPNAAFQKLIGPLNENSHFAKKLVCLEACRQLHKLKALDDHLLPLSSNIEEEKRHRVNKNTKKSSLGAGTTRQKELHGSTSIHDLSGNWANNDDVHVTLKAYKIRFSWDVFGNYYSSFVLLINAALDNDVGNLELNLYLTDKMVKSFVSPCGDIHLDPQKLKKSKLFQEFFFNGLFGKLFSGSKSKGEPRKFVLNAETKPLWSPSKAYLLLPLDDSPTFSQDVEAQIDWNGIDSCVSITDQLSTNSPNILPDCHQNNPDTLHLARQQSLHLSDVKNKVVVAIHTGRMYSIIDLVSNMSANSPFDESKFGTYTNYFKQKYEIDLIHPEQPLLLLKHSHNFHNLLSLHAKCEGDSTSTNDKDTSKVKNTKKQQNVAHMPPELLLVIDVPIGVLRSMYLLPSLMYRLESLMLCSQLRKKINYRPLIPIHQILQALTTLRCSEDFSMERLELLGDSVLKYVVSCNLFLKFPQSHQGQLTASRSLIICNANLNKHGIAKNLQGYIRDSAFDLRAWLAPGQISLYPSPCKCYGLVGIKEDTSKIKLSTDDNSIVLGKSCDLGHRWMCSKTISDCVEALIGVYFANGGLNAAISFLKWLGIEIQCVQNITVNIKEVVKNASLCNFLPNLDQIESLESKLKYSFSTKGIALEAITHASSLQSYCYERLEFLGDSALDLLITSYLFQNYMTLDPGELTDLRSMSVSNNNFARISTKYKFYSYLQYDSLALGKIINEYVKRFSESFDGKDAHISIYLTKSPKVLGDILESIVGAVLVDSMFNLDKIWKIFKPILSPIASPENLELAPFRELVEICDHFGYFITAKEMKEDENTVVELRVQLEDALFIQRGCDITTKIAKGHAATLLLKDLKGKGFHHTMHITLKRKQLEPDSIEVTAASAGHRELYTERSSKKQKSDSVVEVISVVEDKDHEKSFTEPLSKKPNKSAVGISTVAINISSLNKSSQVEIIEKKPAILSVKMSKGGPRIALYELSKKFQWPMPIFDTRLSGGGNINLFKSEITLHLPDSMHTIITIDGDVRTDKKSSQDSAALAMLYELQKLGRCRITEVY